MESARFGDSNVKESNQSFNNPQRNPAIQDFLAFEDSDSDDIGVFKGGLDEEIQ